MKINRILSISSALIIGLGSAVGSFPDDRYTVYAASQLNGTCGVSMSYEFNGTDTLTFSGTGKMYDYGKDYDDNSAPWVMTANINSKTKKVVIQDGISSIGSNAFFAGQTGKMQIPQAMYSLESVELPQSLESIGDNAFFGCAHFTELSIPSNNQYIGENAFFASSLQDIYIYNPNCQIFDNEKTLGTSTIHGYDNSTAQLYAQKYNRSFESMGVMPSDDKSWRDLYADKLLECVQSSETDDYNKYKFTLIYLDNDEVPELIISPKIGIHNSVSVLFDVYDGNLYQNDLGGDYGSFSYKEKENVIAYTHLANGAGTISTLFQYLQEGTLHTYEQEYDEDGFISNNDLTFYDAMEDNIQSIIYGVLNPSIEDPLPERLFDPIIDGTSFTHSSGKTSDGFYNVKNYSVASVFQSELEKNCINPDNPYDKTPLNKLLQSQQRQWGGSCYGLSTLMVLQHMSKVDVTQISQNHPENFHGMEQPYTNSIWLDTINYYQNLLYTYKFGENWGVAYPYQNSVSYDNVEIYKGLYRIGETWYDKPLDKLVDQTTYDLVMLTNSPYFQELRMNDLTSGNSKVDESRIAADILIKERRQTAIVQFWKQVLTIMQNNPYKSFTLSYGTLDKNTKETYGHTVVIYNCIFDGTLYSISMYDVNLPGNELKIKVSKDGKEFSFYDGKGNNTSTNNFEYLLFEDSMQLNMKILPSDIQISNSKIYNSGDLLINKSYQDKASIYFNPCSSFLLKSSNGSYFLYDGEFGGTDINIFQYRLLPCDDSYEIQIEIEPSDYYIVENYSNSLSLTLGYNQHYFSIDDFSGDKVTYDIKNDKLQMNGQSSLFTATISNPDAECNLIEIPMKQSNYSSVSIASSQLSISSDQSLVGTDIQSLTFEQSNSYQLKDSNTYTIECTDSGKLQSSQFVSVVASGECGLGDDDLIWTLNNDGLLKISGTGSMSDYGSEINSPWHDRLDEIQSVIISDGVENIGARAFADCDNLCTITLPDCIKAIGLGAFTSCRSLTEISIPEETETISRGAFMNCDKLKTVTIPKSTIMIDEMAFDWCDALQSITILNPECEICDFPETISCSPLCEDYSCIIYGYNNSTAEAFAKKYKRNFKSLGDAPDSTTIIASGQCGSTGDNLTWTLDDEGMLTISGEGMMTDWEMDFYPPWYENREKVKTVKLSDGVTSIGDDAFCNCKYLTTVTIPKSVTTIGFGAFQCCESLNSITIPDSVTGIGRNAFYRTPLLKAKKEENPLVIVNNILIDGTTCSGNVTIPEGVTIIGEGAFYLCKSLTGIIIPSSVTSISSSAFASCTNLSAISIPESVTKIGGYAFSHTPWLEAKQKENPLVIVNNILIDGTACSEAVTIPDSVTSVAANAFYNCENLTDIIIPDSVTYIGENAFANCSLLTKITVGMNNQNYCSVDGVLYTKRKDAILSFPAGKLVSYYIIPDSVTNIISGAFAGCFRLTDITIPDSVTNIGSSAFCRCFNLTDITIKNPNCEIYRGVDTICNQYFTADIIIALFNGTIHGYTGSTAEAYAQKRDIKFVEINNTLDSEELGGDLNGDGMIMISDAVFFARIVSESLYRDDITSPERLYAADFDNDGLLTIIDVAIFLKKFTSVY